MDVHDKKTRSYNMSRIKSKNTKPEEIVRTVIFVNGCFWHGHKECKYFVVPKTNTEFWLNKINANIDRDVIKATQLRELGWRVITIWECELKKDKREQTLENIINTIMT